MKSRRKRKTMKTIRLEVSESPKALASRCISVHEDGGVCPVGDSFRCPFRETYCTSVAPWMWEELMEEDSSCGKADAEGFMPVSRIAVSRPFSICPEGEAPAGWVRDTSPGPFEAFWCKGRKLLVLSSFDTDVDGNDWLHVSLSLPNKLPSWQDVKLVKRLFFGAEETAWQCIAPDSQWVDQHKYCFHLWALWPFQGAQDEEGEAEGDGAEVHGR